MMHLHPLLETIARKIGEFTFPGSAEYWERRYARGGHAGAGSAGAAFWHKVEVVSRMIEWLGGASVLDVGCGPRPIGPHLEGCESYMGVDVSRTAIEDAKDRPGRSRCPTQAYLTLEEFWRFAAPVTFDVALSLEVIPHLVEGEAFLDHLEILTERPRSQIIVLSTDGPDKRYYGPHWRGRAFVGRIESRGWQLVERWENPHCASDWYRFQRT